MVSYIPSMAQYKMLTAHSSNMLYPKEDPESHRLNFACRTCQYSEEATSSCVFRNILNNAVGETAGVTQDVGSDPTVGLPLCLLCGSVILCEGRQAREEVDSAAEDESH
jgi:DNA-directed RNA polymerase subunit M/transcription elongation factor TFIIS